MFAKPGLVVLTFFVRTTQQWKKPFHCKHGVINYVIFLNMLHDIMF